MNTEKTTLALLLGIATMASAVAVHAEDLGRRGAAGLETRERTTKATPVPRVGTGEAKKAAGAPEGDAPDAQTVPAAVTSEVRRPLSAQAGRPDDKAY